eukprot:46213-Pleurochrysis_carterae.AAC.1
MQAANGDVGRETFRNRTAGIRFLPSFNAFNGTQIHKKLATMRIHMTSRYAGATVPSMLTDLVRMVAKHP